MKKVFFFEANRKYRNLLLHYKAIPQNFNKVDIRHTNNWEISEIVRSFISLGWSVELVDRTCSDWSPSRNYDLFISNASGSLGNRFLEMAKQIPDVKTVLYAAGPAVDVSDQLVDERYQSFQMRHEITEKTEHLRTFRTNIDDIMSFVDEIICIDDNGFSSGTYKRFNKPIHRLRPSTPNDSFDGRLERFRKDKNSFVMFLGNGFIAKGADIVLDTFSSYPELQLQVCGPYKQDKFFWNFYRRKLGNMPNVTFNGFVPIGSKKYFKIISRSAWQIHNSAAEGCATSVTNLMQGGLLPISNFETGVDIRNFGLEISNIGNNFVDSTSETIEKALSVHESFFNDSLKNMYYANNKFTQTAFRDNLAKIIQKLI